MQDKDNKIRTKRWMPLFPSQRALLHSSGAPPPVPPLQDIWRINWWPWLPGQGLRLLLYLLLLLILHFLLLLHQLQAGVHCRGLQCTLGSSCLPSLFPTDKGSGVAVLIYLRRMTRLNGINQLMIKIK